MRIPVTDATLAHLVVEDLRDRTTAGAEFTAYDVTRRLRDLRPEVDIRHAKVRIVVHGYMRALLAEGLYQASARRYAKQTAMLYEPVSRDAWSDGIPLLPLDD